MTCYLKMTICISLLLATSGCAQMRSGRSLEQVVGGTNKTHELYFGMARIAERNGKTENARKAYQRILEQDPEHIESLHRMAVTSVTAESLDEAINYFEKAISRAEPTGDLLGDYGYALYLIEDFDASESALARARKLLPDDPRVANNLGLVLGRQGRYDEAYELFQLSGERAEALANLAYVQSQAGDISFAKENYHQALAFDPTLAVAANGLYEIHAAFPDHDSMLIKPFRGVTDNSPERLARQTGSAVEIDQLIRTISIKHGGSARPNMDRPVVQAAYEAPIQDDGGSIEATYDVDDVPQAAGADHLLLEPESAPPMGVKRIPNQLRKSSRRPVSAVGRTSSSER